jgi:hypothetical protein
VINKKNYYGHVLDLDKGDERIEKYNKQRKEDGFDDTETWSLNSSISAYMVPRLRRLIEIQEENILEPYEGYFLELKLLLLSLDSYKKDSWDSEAIKNIQILFPKVFPYLWW